MKVQASVLVGAILVGAVLSQEITKTEFAFVDFGTDDALQRGGGCYCPELTNPDVVYTYADGHGGCKKINVYGKCTTTWWKAQSYCKDWHGGKLWEPRTQNEYNVAMSAITPSILSLNLDMYAFHFGTRHMLGNTLATGTYATSPMTPTWTTMFGATGKLEQCGALYDPFASGNYFWVASAVSCNDYCIPFICEEPCSCTCTLDCHKVYSTDTNQVKCPVGYEMTSCSCSVPGCAGTIQDGVCKCNCNEGICKNAVEAQCCKLH